MKSSTLLRKAAEVLATGEVSGVCWALHVASGSTGHLVNAKPEARKIIDRIQKSIEPACYVDGWLRRNCKEFRTFERKCENNAEVDAALRDYRIRWCEWMAEVYERIGD